MVVQWVTKNSSNPVVKWGTSSGAYTHTAAATSSTYTRQELCGAPANAEGFVDPGLFHAALLEGLEPDHRYHYVVGDEVRPMMLASISNFDAGMICLHAQHAPLVFSEIKEYCGSMWVQHIVWCPLCAWLQLCDDTGSCRICIVKQSVHHVVLLTQPCMKGSILVNTNTTL
jgi:hypothetical protein